MLNRFLFSHACGAFATGIHIVLIAWLAVGALDLPAQKVGWLQAATLLPNLFLMLLAGVWADRYNSASIVAFAYVLHAIAHIFLSYLLFTGQLNFIYLMSYGVAVGIGNAFIQPVREKLLSSIDDHHVQKRFSYASTVQFSFQSLGIIFASTTDWVGYSWIVLIQSGCALFSAVSVLSLKQCVDKPLVHSRHFLSEAIQGFKAVKTDRALSQLMLLIGFNGYMHLGVYLVMLPLLAKSVYAFTALQYGGLQLTFVLGMIGAHLILLKKETLQFPGQGALFSLIYTAVVGFALAKQPTVAGFYFLVFSWGFVAGNSAGRCRLVVQAIVAPELKGRIMSIYQFVLFGSAPLGALMTGYVVDFIRINEVFYIMSISSVIMFMLYFFGSAIWSVEQEAEK